MVYKVIGLMSGSSLDGLDIVFTHLEESRGVWKFEIKNCDCIPYNEEWQNALKTAKNQSVSNYLLLHTRYGKYLAECVNAFIEKHLIHHQVDFIATHGHTVFHDPVNYTSVQIGCGATLAAHTQLPVISDLRAMDVALGGQGAPIVPIGDKLLFPEYDYLLNIGGIVNITIKRAETLYAFDVCTGNQALNTLAQRAGKEMDKNGAMAGRGKLLGGIFDTLNAQDYFHRHAPKSLSNEAAQELIFPILMESEHDTNDLLHTVVKHIAEQVSNTIIQSGSEDAAGNMLVTGGGAFNRFLVEEISEKLQPLGINITVPDETVVKYKEALVMALIGALRWREEANVLASVTGASYDSIGGALWMGQR